MNYVTKPIKVKAVKWRGWPHAINGLVEHPQYPQLGAIQSSPIYDICLLDVYAENWIVTFPDKHVEVMDNVEFKKKFKSK